MHNLERYNNILPVFGINSGWYEINFFKSYLFPHLINEKEIEPTVITKANDFVSFKIEVVEPPDIIKFLGGATTLDSILKAYKAREMKGYFRCASFDTPSKLYEQQLPSFHDY